MTSDVVRDPGIRRAVIDRGLIMRVVLSTNQDTARVYGSASLRTKKKLHSLNQVLIGKDSCKHSTNTKTLTLTCITESPNVPMDTVTTGHDQ